MNLPKIVAKLQEFRNKISEIHNDSELNPFLIEVENWLDALPENLRGSILAKFNSIAYSPEAFTGQDDDGGGCMRNGLRELDALLRSTIERLEISIPSEGSGTLEALEFSPEQAKKIEGILTNFRSYLLLLPKRLDQMDDPTEVDLELSDYINTMYTEIDRVLGGKLNIKDGLYNFLSPIKYSEHLEHKSFVTVNLATGPLKNVIIGLIKAVDISLGKLRRNGIVIEKVVINNPEKSQQLEKDKDFYSIVEDIKKSFRKIVKKQPSSENDIQDDLECFLDVKEYSFKREKESVGFSEKSFKPDFTNDELKAAIEVKFIDDKSKISRIIEEMSADMRPYSRRWKKILFLIYDVGGNLSDVDKFSKDFEKDARPTIRCVVIKQ